MNCLSTPSAYASKEEQGVGYQTCLLTAKVYVDRSFRFADTSLITSPSILVFGSAPDLLNTRRLVLQHAGFDVTVSLSLDRTTELLVSRPFDLFILCHSLSSPACESALQVAHTACPKTRNLVLLKMNTVRKLAEDDTLLAAFASPQALIAAARSMTSSVSPRPQLTSEVPVQIIRDIG